jgi:ribosome-associated heat shock protein Hsp15
VTPKAPASAAQEPQMRLDKWLWAARFFKTRQLAIDAINGGKVHVNEQRTKPGKTISVGAQLSITKEPYTWDIEVKHLDAQRRSAELATRLYEETPESLEKRRKEIETRREEREFGAVPDQRPTKKERRQIHRFKRLEPNP